jgi:hypothetical protein
MASKEAYVLKMNPKGFASRKFSAMDESKAVADVVGVGW